MGKMGSIDIRGLKELEKQMSLLDERKRQMFIENCAKELAARLLGLVIQRTPPGKYSNEVSFVANIPEKRVTFTTKDGKEVDFIAKARTKKVSFQIKSVKQGGTLRRGWTANKDMGAKAYAQSLPIHKEGNAYVITVVNNVEYASYVEYGHRVANSDQYVKERLMLTKSSDEVEQIAPALLAKRLETILKDVFT